MYVCMYVCIYVRMCTCVCMYVYVCIYVLCIYVYMYVYMCMYVCVCVGMYVYKYLCVYVYRVSQEECARLRENILYVKVHLYNAKHLCRKLNGYGDNGQRKIWSSNGSTYCTC
jgi:hypothetical protein